MGSIDRRDFSLGWQPDMDAVNAAPNALLRMDNCVLDELGAVSLRQGSAKVNSGAFSDLDVHSLYTTTLGGTRYRMAGASNAVYANGASIATGINGSNDIFFGSHMGHILFARGTSRKKYDGTTVRNLGIAAPAAPTIAALSADSKTLATCASAESPAFSSNEGTQAFTTDKDSTANAALQLTPDSSTARATSTKTFSSATNFTVYDGGQAGTDDDLVEFLAYFTEPQYVDRVTLMIDVNDGTFQSDYYYWDFINGDPINVELTDEEYLASNYDVEGFDREAVLARLESHPITSTFRSDKPVSDAGWNRLSVPRGKMRRIGNTAGKNWSTVKAVRLVYVALAAGSGAIARFDQIQMTGGLQRPLTGRYKAVLVAIRSDGTYVGKSPVSSMTSELEVKASGIQATVTAASVAALDSQVNELWLYLMGGRLDGFYKAAAAVLGFDYTQPFERDYFTSVNGRADFTYSFEAQFATGVYAGNNYIWELTGGYANSGAVTIDAIGSDRSLLIQNERLETDNILPPDNIIGIEGPHYDRTLYLTATSIYPSRRLNPDSCSSGEIVTVGGADEINLWIKRLDDYVYVGTTKDIYRIIGDWTPQPNGVLNIIKRPLGLTRPPMSSAVTTGKINSVETLVYLTSDGWQVLGGPLLTATQVSFLWRKDGQHSVSAVNTTAATARFRCAITKNQLYAITPEGSDTTSSVTLHVYNFALTRWYRWTYASSWRSIAAEADGTLISGSTAGFVWTLDDTTTRQDGGVDIAVAVWTRQDDAGQQFTVKDPESLLLDCAASATVAAAFHIDGSASADTSFNSDADSSGASVLNVSSASEFRQLQLRLTGSFSSFRLHGFAVHFLDRPLPLVIHDTGFVELTDTSLAWCRRLNIKARASGNLTVQPYYDGTAGTERTVTVTAGKEIVYPVPLGREDKGTTARAVITSTDPSNIYWIEWEYNVSGKIRQKRVFLNKEAAA